MPARRRGTPEYRRPEPGSGAEYAAGDLLLHAEGELHVVERVVTPAFGLVQRRELGVDLGEVAVRVLLLQVLGGKLVELLRAFWLVKLHIDVGDERVRTPSVLGERVPELPRGLEGERGSFLGLAEPRIRSRLVDLVVCSLERGAAPFEDRPPSLEMAKRFLRLAAVELGRSDDAMGEAQEVGVLGQLDEGQRPMCVGGERLGITALAAQLGLRPEQARAPSGSSASCSAESALAITCSARVRSPESVSA